MDKPSLEHFVDDAESGSEATAVLAERGDADAQFSVALKFATEEGSPDYEQAANWYLKAAEQDHAMAQFNLGVMYSRGQGLVRDEVQSMIWLKRAAHLGDAGAQHTLGLKQNRASMDETPSIARETRIEAYKWLQIASAQGYAGSRAGCDFVAMDMTRECVVEGDRRAAAFVAAHQNP